MNKLFFVPSTKINARIADTVITGQHITIEGLTTKWYQEDLKVEEY